MFRIGICDDNPEDSNKIENLCRRCLQQDAVGYQFVFFASGEEVLDYCEQGEKERIDLLFLDVEMGGMNGIEVKDRVAKKDGIWRIVFVSNHSEAMAMAFGIKTLGFLNKPPKLEQIARWIQVVREEMEENIILNFEGLTEDIRLEEIEYLEGARSYAIIHFRNRERTEVITRNLKYGERLLSGLPFVRVHKSYIVNLQHVARITKEVELKDSSSRIPVGRIYKDKAVERYQHYLKGKRAYMGIRP